VTQWSFIGQSDHTSPVTSLRGDAGRRRAVPNYQNAEEGRGKDVYGVPLLHHVSAGRIRGCRPIRKNCGHKRLILQVIPTTPLPFRARVRSRAGAALCRECDINTPSPHLTTTSATIQHVCRWTWRACCRASRTEAGAIRSRSCTPRSGPFFGRTAVLPRSPRPRTRKRSTTAFASTRHRTSSRTRWEGRSQLSSAIWMKKLPNGSSSGAGLGTSRTKLSFRPPLP
jgi:hypothetical protein